MVIVLKASLSALRRKPAVSSEWNASRFLYIRHNTSTFNIICLIIFSKGRVILPFSFVWFYQHPTQPQTYFSKCLLRVQTLRKIALPLSPPQGQGSTLCACKGFPYGQWCAAPCPLTSLFRVCSLGFARTENS